MAVQCKFSLQMTVLHRLPSPHYLEREPSPHEKVVQWAWVLNKQRELNAFSLRLVAFKMNEASQVSNLLI